MYKVLQEYVKNRIRETSNLTFRLTKKYYRKQLWGKHKWVNVQHGIKIIVTVFRKKEASLVVQPDQENCLARSTAGRCIPEPQGAPRSL